MNHRFCRWSGAILATIIVWPTAALAGAPHIEVNYGVVPDVQLRVITPLAYAVPPNGGSHYGYGDTELGIKYRFVAETDNLPQIGVFPLLEVPSGNGHEGLGSEQLQAAASTLGLQRLALRNRSPAHWRGRLSRRRGKQQPLMHRNRLMMEG